MNDTRLDLIGPGACNPRRHPMSKASEYTKAFQAYLTSPGIPDKMYFQGTNYTHVAWVTGNGNLMFNGELLPNDAIAFAHWILDTFSEPEGSK